MFADVDNSDRIAQEEIFGPVLAVIAYDDDADAMIVVPRPPAPQKAPGLATIEAWI